MKAWTETEDLVTCEECGEACHGLVDDAGGRLMRCPKHLPGPSRDEAAPESRVEPAEELPARKRPR